MITRQLSTSDFPAFKQSVRAHWAPLILEPIAGSYERLVVGVAVVSNDGFHIELANALHRLHCLYADNANAANYAIQLAAEYLRHDLTKRSLDALINPEAVVSGVRIGECREAEGESLKQIGASWMSILSSLYDQELDRDARVERDLSDHEEDEDAQREIAGDRLPVLVLEYVKRRREGLAPFFRPDLHEKRRRNNHDVIIDFAGSRLVANFGTLQARQLARSINTIKRRLWDLKVERDREVGPLLVRRHEMIVQAPSKDDPQITSRQLSNILEAVKALETQAKQEALTLTALPTVAEIGEHVLNLEVAA